MNVDNPLVPWWSKQETAIHVIYGDVVMTTFITDTATAFHSMFQPEGEVGYYYGTRLIEEMDDRGNLIPVPHEYQKMWETNWEKYATLTFES